MRRCWQAQRRDVVAVCWFEAVVLLHVMLLERGAFFFFFQSVFTSVMCDSRTAERCKAKPRWTCMQFSSSPRCLFARNTHFRFHPRGALTPRSAAALFASLITRLEEGYQLRWCAHGALPVFIVKGHSRPFSFALALRASISSPLSLSFRISPKKNQG